MNKYTHFYLYAKKWYKSSGDVIADLRKIQSLYSGIPEQYISEYDIKTVLNDILFDEVSKNIYTLSYFISKIEQKGYYEAVLITLSNCLVKDIGRPDSSVLPYGDDVTEDIINDPAYRWSE